MLNNLANINYLKIIFESNTVDGLDLSDKIKLKAKQKYHKQIKKIFEDKNSTYLTYETIISFSSNCDHVINVEFINNRNILVEYDKKWINENLDYPTLLNNFIYLFGYTDLYFRFLNVNKKYEMGIFEKYFEIKGKKEYYTGDFFYQKQFVAYAQMLGYCEELKKHNIYLEDIIKWFFEVYLKKEFNVQGFIFKEATKNIKYHEKCKNIAPQFDSILKQFKIFCEEGEVNKELFRISSKHMFIKNIPSMLENKYIYPCGGKYKKISYLLFSDQSELKYIQGRSEDYRSFYELILKENVYYNMLKNYQKSSVDYLIKNNLLKLDNNKIIKPNKIKVKILKELYENEVVCYYYLKKYQSTIEELDDEGLIEFSSSLFSKPEQAYYNYLFNNAEFSNGPQLSNKYRHGNEFDEEKHNMHDYYVFLQMMILIIIKINEEFCLKYPEKSN